MRKQDTKQEIRNRETREIWVNRLLKAINSAKNPIPKVLIDYAQRTKHTQF